MVKLLGKLTKKIECASVAGQLVTFSAIENPNTGMNDATFEKE